MKQLLIALSFVFAWVSCDTDTSVEQKEDTETKQEEKDAEPDNDILIGVPYFSTNVYILYVDENKKSIFDPEGKNWSKEDVKIFYHIEGKGTYPEDADRDSGPYAPILDEFSVPPFVSNGNGNHTFPKDPWLRLHPSYYLDPGEEFRTVLVTFPNQTTDTIRYQLGEYGLMKNVWHNGVLKFDGYDEEDHYNVEHDIFVTFSDGSKSYPNGIWWEAEK